MSWPGWESSYIIEVNSEGDELALIWEGPWCFQDKEFTRIKAEDSANGVRRYLVALISTSDP